MPSDTPEQIAAEGGAVCRGGRGSGQAQCSGRCSGGSGIEGLKGRAYESEREASADHMMAYWAKGIDELQLCSRIRRGGISDAFIGHWLSQKLLPTGGFDAFVGNPPFIGGKKIEAALGDEYREYVASYWAME